MSKLKIVNASNLQNKSPTKLTKKFGTEVASTTKFCDTCRRVVNSNMRCSICQCSYYCDSKCQHDDWPAHKQKCYPSAAAHFAQLMQDTNILIRHYREDDLRNGNFTLTSDVHIIVDKQISASHVKFVVLIVQSQQETKHFFKAVSFVDRETTLCWYNVVQINGANLSEKVNRVCMDEVPEEIRLARKKWQDNSSGLKALAEKQEGDFYNKLLRIVTIKL